MMTVATMLYGMTTACRCCAGSSVERARTFSGRRTMLITEAKSATAATTSGAT